MRRTVLSSLALAGTAVLAGAMPAFADGTSPSPVPARTATPSPSVVSATPSAAPSAAPARTAAPSQVGRVPAGAPDTGVTSPSARSGNDGALIGGGAAALAVGGATILVVRRRRATGA